MFKSFCELPKRAIERSGHAQLFAPVGDRAVHKIHFGLAFGKNILKHARFVLARSICAFLHQGSRIAMELDSQSLCDGFAFGNESVKKRVGRRKARRCTVMQQCKRPNGICRRVENELGPLGAAGVAEGDYAHSSAVEKFGELFYEGEWRVRRFEWADPGIAVDVEACVAGLDNVSSGKSGATYDVTHMLGKNLFVTNTILNRADGAILAENVSGLFNGGARVRAFCGNNSEIALRNFVGVGSCVQARSEIGGATYAQAVPVDRVSVLFPDVVGVDLDVFEAGQMRAKDASNGAAADNANLHAHAVFSASSPG